VLDCSLGADRPAELPWAALGAPARDQFTAGLPLLVGDARTDPATAGAFEDAIRPLRWRSLAVVPLGGGGEALWLAARLPRSWSAADGRLLRSAADLLALAWESGRTMAALRRAQRSRDEYLAMLAHELRGPMAPMRTDLSMLAAHIDPLTEAERLRGRVERQLAQLARLTDGLLDIARLTQGKVTLRRAAVDLRRVVEAAVEGCRSALAGRRQELALRLPDDPVVVDGDAARLEQVVANLLANASKYTPEGGHAWVALGAADGEAVLAVRDDGIGLTREFLPHVFEPFTQSERGADRAAGGLGLGLALVRRIVELHGGRVLAESPGAGRGATFTVRLPLRRNGEAADDEGAAAGPAPAAPLRVLVVDDSRDTRESLAEWLRLQGHEAVTAAHADEARALARETRPDVALLDLGLPGIDGFELARLLRADLGAIRLIATSGYGQSEALEQSRQAGFDLHLVKPLDLRALREALSA
jgi:signal transduction histidine kinase/CheY-like chemotaxis protein